MPEEKIVCYGTAWCGHTRRSRALMDACGTVYRWVDIDQDAEGRAFVEQVNRGLHSVPTICFPDGTVLVEPSDEQLRNKLGR
jgi:mycoredoxin